MAEGPKTFGELSKLKYKDQAIWFLNGYWGEEGGIKTEEASKVWNYIRKFVELDLLSSVRKGEDGNELDQFWSAKFLEDMDAAMPAMQRKEALRSIDQDSNGKMSAIEYLVWKYKKGVKETEEAPQGDNTEAIKKAQEAIDAVQEQLQECERRLEAQKQAKIAQEEAKASQEQARKAQEQAKASQEQAKKQNDEKKRQNDKAKEENDSAVVILKKAEADLQAAEDELAAAINDLKQQEEEYKSKCDSLESKSKDASISVVQRNKAANELAQLKGEDPLPLRKAKITQEAALRKVQKQKKSAEEAREVQEAKGRELDKTIKELEKTIRELEQAIRELEQAIRELDEAIKKMEKAIRDLEQAVRELEQAYADLEQKMTEAQEELEKIRSKPGGGKGAIWWLQRELFEADNRLPRAKQKFDHSKPFSFDV